MLVTKTAQKYHKHKRSPASPNADVKYPKLSAKSVIAAVAAAHTALTHAPVAVVTDATLNWDNPITSDSATIGLIAYVIAIVAVIAYSGFSSA